VWWATKTRCLRTRQSSKVQSLALFVRETISESSSPSNLPKETSTSSKLPRILSQVKWQSLKAGNVSRFSRWTDSCRLRLTATCSLRCSLTRSRMPTGLLKQVSPKTTNSTDRRPSFSKEVLSRFHLCTKTRSTSVQYWKWICKLQSASSRRVSRGSSSWRRNTNSRGTRTTSWRKSWLSCATKSSRWK